METATIQISTEYDEGNIDEILEVISNYMPMEYTVHQNSYGGFMVEFNPLDEEEEEEA